LTANFDGQLKKTRAARQKESSSAYFEKLRPKFLDWQPLTDAEEAAMRKRYRSGAARPKRTR
jgi:hypothetical protein